VTTRTDQQLLQEFTESHSDSAFAELVARYLDLVYSCALRLVEDPHTAKDLTQSVFIALAKGAPHLVNHPVLSGWLHSTTRNVAAKWIRSDTRRRAREQEAAATHLSESPPQDVIWDQIANHLDEALGSLSDPDRDSVVLRYFEKKSAVEMASRLGISAEAAQKRVSRAVERLRKYYAQRGIRVAAGGLALAISTNAVNAAPGGLATSISAGVTAAVGIATASTAPFATSTVVKVIAMNAIQKTLIATALTAAVGAGWYESRRAASYRQQVITLEQQLTPLAEQVRQLQEERNDSSNRLNTLTEAVTRLNQTSTEVLTALRGPNPSRPSPLGTDSAGRLAGARAPTETVASDPTRMGEEAWRLWQNGKFNEAIPRFEAALQLEPKNAGLWNGLGWATFNSGKSEEAEKAFQETLGLEPEHPAALNGMGQLKLSQKKYDEAERYLLAAGPKAPAAWYGLARLYLIQNRFEDAEKWAQRIIDSGQGNEPVRAMLKAAIEKRVSEGLQALIDPP